VGHCRPGFTAGAALGIENGSLERRDDVVLPDD
jgi:hypothetical protein